MINDILENKICFHTLIACTKNYVIFGPEKRIPEKSVHAKRVREKESICVCVCVGFMFGFFYPSPKFSFCFRRRKFIKTAAAAAALSFRDTRAGARLISFLLHPTPVAGVAVACDPAVVIIQYVYTRGGKKEEKNSKKQK